MEQDNEGFLVSEDPNRAEVLDEIHADVRAIRSAIVGGAVGKSIGRAVADAVRSRTPATPNGRASRGMSAAVGGTGRVSEPTSSGGGKRAQSVVNPNAANRPSVPGGSSAVAERDSRGRFTSNGSGANDGGSSEIGAIRGLARKLAAFTRLDGLEEADPNIKAMQEIATPIARGYELLGGGNPEKKKDGWFRKIFNTLKGFRKDEKDSSKATNKSLKNLEDGAGGAGGTGEPGFAGMTAGITSRILPFLGTLFTRIFGPIALVIGAWKIGQWIGTKINEWLVSSGITDAVFKAFDWVKESISSAWESAVEKFTSAVDIISRAAAWISQKIGLAWSNTKKTVSSAWDNSVAGKAVGWISKRFESGRGGSGTVSTGKGDNGGASYGTHQLSSKEGTLQKFLAQSGYASQFKGLTPGSAEFNKKWKEVAANDPERFGAAQHDFIKKTHYDPAYSSLKKSGIDLSQRGQAVREAMWSTSVQFGGTGGAGLVAKALSGKDVAGMSDADIVSAIQDYKAKNNDRLFASSSHAVRASTARRAQDEKAALVSLAGTVSVSAPPVNAPKISAMPSPADAPTMQQKLGSRDASKSITVNVPQQDVTQDVRDRRIAHVVTGGYGGDI